MVTRMLGLTALALGLIAVPAEAKVQQIDTCGVTIDSGKWALAANLSCDQSPAITVVGPAQLDLRRHTITCTGTGTLDVGIKLQGSGAAVRNGTVAGCPFGLDWRDGAPGGHRVSHVEARDGRTGFAVRGDGNRLDSVVARDNSTIGIAVFSGDANEVSRAKLERNPYGVNVYERTDRTKVRWSVTDGGGAAHSGFLDVGVNNLFQGNQARNHSVGFDIYCDFCGTYLGNRAENSGGGSGIGFRILGRGGKFERNLARNNESDGFRLLSSATGNTLERNRASGNDVDIVDEQVLGSGDVCQNTYIRNRFGTASGECAP
jgi:parallel beta-helix repeat protein